MKTYAQTVRTIDLGYEQFFIFAGQPQARVRVLFGGAWLTEEGVAHDSIVGAGDETELRGSGSVLLEAAGPTRVQLIEPAMPAPARSAQWLRRAGAQLQQFVRRLHLGLI